MMVPRALTHDFRRDLVGWTETGDVDPLHASVLALKQIEIDFTHAPFNDAVG